MPNTNPTYDEEIDFVGLIETLWKGKWKIFLFIFVPLLIIFLHQILSPRNFIAITTIKPITSVEFDKYRLYNGHIEVNETINTTISPDSENDIKENVSRNDLRFDKISPDLLLELFLEQLEEGTLFEKAIKKFSLLEKNQYENEIAYNDAVIKLASQIEILKPSELRKKGDNQTSKYHTIKFEYNDSDKWKEALSFVYIETNKVIQKAFNNRFETNISLAKQDKKFRIEDINTKIKNNIKNYDFRVNVRLAFLKEQAAIARKLNVENNTIEAQLFNSQNSVVTNVKTDTPFYLRGYKAIEEEMLLIKKRIEKKNFIPEIADLENEKVKLNTNKLIDRFEILFANTPISQNNFKSVLLKVPSTTFEYNKNYIFFYALVLILGSIIGILYVIITNALRKRYI